MSLTVQQHQLIQFAATTLNILQNSEEWSAETLDTIQSSAFDIGLAEVDDEGLFEIKPHVDTCVPEPIDSDELDDLTQWRVAVTMKPRTGDSFKIVADEVTVWARSDDDELSPEEAAGRVAIKLLASKYKLSPEEIKDRDFITECLCLSFWILSPDKFPIRNKPFNSTAEAVKFVAQWIAQYASQGYYLDASLRKIPVTNLHQLLKITHNSYSEFF